MEDAVPGENELYYLINEPMRYMEEYGDGIYAVSAAAIPTRRLKRVRRR